MKSNDTAVDSCNFLLYAFRYIAKCISLRPNASRRAGAEWKSIWDATRCIWTQRSAFGSGLHFGSWRDRPEMHFVLMIVPKCISFVPRCIWWFEIPKRVSTHPNAFGDEPHLGCNTTTKLHWFLRRNFLNARLLSASTIKQISPPRLGASSYHPTMASTRGPYNTQAKPTCGFDIMSDALSNHFHKYHSTSAKTITGVVNTAHKHLKTSFHASIKGVPSSQSQSTPNASFITPSMNRRSASHLTPVTFPSLDDADDEPECPIQQYTVSTSSMPKYRVAIRLWGIYAYLSWCVLVTVKTSLSTSHPPLRTIQSHCGKRRWGSGENEEHDTVQSQKELNSSRA